jgi:hypothetical protein
VVPSAFSSVCSDCTGPLEAPQGRLPLVSFAHNLLEHVWEFAQSSHCHMLEIASFDARPNQVQRCAFEARIRFALIEPVGGEACVVHDNVALIAVWA